MIEPDLQGQALGGDKDLLADAGRLLAGSLHPDVLVARLLELLVPDAVALAQVSIVETDRVHHATYRSSASSQPVSVSWQPPRGDRHGVAGVVASARRAVRSLHDRGDVEGVVAPSARPQVITALPCEAVVLPLSARGTVFGALTLVDDADRQPRVADRLPLWEELAGRAALAIDTARMFQDRHHALAVLQRDLHPPILPAMDGLDVAAFYRPASGPLGGDFYDVHGDDEGWTFVLGDVAGKGVEAAVFAGRARQTVRTAAMVDRAPAAVMDLLNRVLVADADPSQERFLSAVCLRLVRGPAGWAVEAASAGHPSPLVLRADGEVVALSARGLLAGIADVASYETAAVDLADGDVLVLFTDGITESRNAEGEQFGVARVREELASLTGVAAEVVAGHLARTALEWQATAGQDDIALLAIRVDPSGDGS